MIALPLEFGIIVETDAMTPVYDRGDTILCKTRSLLRAGRDYVIAARGNGRIAFDNEAKPTIMRIAGIEQLTARHLFAREFNPPKIR